MRILCGFLTIMGFLIKSCDRYGLTEDTAFFLDRKSPASIEESLEFVPGFSKSTMREVEATGNRILISEA